MSRADWGDFFGALGILALVYVLVRPASIAPQFISAVGSGVQALVTFAVSG